MSPCPVFTWLNSSTRRRPCSHVACDSRSRRQRDGELPRLAGEYRRAGSGRVWVSRLVGGCACHEDVLEGGRAGSIECCACHDVCPCCRPASPPSPGSGRCGSVVVIAARRCGLLPNQLFLPSPPDNFGQVGRRRGPTRHQSWAVVSAEWAGWRLWRRGRAVLGSGLCCEPVSCGGARRQVQGGAGGGEATALLVAPRGYGRDVVLASRCVILRPLVRTAPDLPTPTHTSCSWTPGPL